MKNDERKQMKGRLAGNELARQRERLVELEEAVAELGKTLEAVKQSEKRYRHIVEDHTEFICRFRPGGIINFANPALNRLTGQAPGSLVGKSFFSYIPSPDREGVERAISSLNTENAVSTVEHRVIMIDGSISWQQWTNRAIFDTKGRFVEYQSVGRDITALKQAEEALRKSEEKNRHILDNVTDGIYMIGADGYFTYLNRASLKRSGLPEDQYNACHYLDMVAPEDRERVRANFERVMRGEENPPYELCTKNRDGRNVSLEVKSRPLFEGEKVVGLLGIARDITARKQAKAALRKSEEKYRVLLESISDGVYHLDATGRFVYMNRSALQRTGFTEENLQTFHFLDIAAPEEREKVRANFEKVMKGKEVPPFELKYVSRNGRTVHVEVRYRPIIENRTVVGLVVITRDITDRKKAEELILNAKNRLEQMVNTRTKELEEKAEQLSLRTRSLEEMNTALDVLLKKIENDKREIENNIRANLQESLFPLLLNLKNSKLSEAQKACINVMEETVNAIAAPFVKNLRLRHSILTPKEIQVCSLIKEDRTTKEIAAILNVSVKDVEFHRYNIRKKLNLTRKKTSLSAYLSQLFDH
jgi:PAS domain S-box-containing protein